MKYCHQNLKIIINFVDKIIHDIKQVYNKCNTRNYNDYFIKNAKSFYSILKQNYLNFYCIECYRCLPFNTTHRLYVLTCILVRNAYMAGISIKNSLDEMDSGIVSAEIPLGF